MTERGRVEETYASYAENERKRRSWAAENPGNIAIRRELVEIAFALGGDALRGHGRVLDAGCGTGWWLEVLADRPDVNAQLHGMDVLEGRVEAARQRVPAATVCTGDMRSLPYDNGHFQAVTLYTVLSSLASRHDIALALHESARVLAPGGALLIWDARIPNPLNTATTLVSPRLLRDALPDARIESRTVTLLPPLARRLGRRTDALYPRLARLSPLRSHRLTLARP